MSTQSWQTFSVIFGIVGVITTIYYLQRSSSRELARLRDARDAKIAEDTARPLLAQIATQDRTIERLTVRVDQLEDELRRGRGHGDNDSQRQPRNRG